MSAKKISYIGMLSAISIIFGYIESLFPACPIPGIKLGISNIVVLFAIYKEDNSSAFFVMLIKVLVSCLLFSGLNVFFYSVSGGILSYLAMILTKKLFSVVGVSVLGGICHNLGQLLTAAFMMQTYAVFVYAPYLIIAGVCVGFVTGTVCKAVLKYI